VSTRIIDQYIIRMNTEQPLCLREILSANMKKFRKRLGISQEELAECASLSWHTINSIESKRVWVSDKTLLALARALEVETYQLLLPETADARPPPSVAEILRKLEKTKRVIDARFEDIFKMAE
jgi:transcriptional regulator with XRE-family HTH domain